MLGRTLLSRRYVSFGLGLSLAFNALIFPTMSSLAGVSATPANSPSGQSLGFNDLVALGDCEKKLYGGVHSNLPGAKRVESLENDVFGEVKKGLLADRVQALRRAINPQTPSLLSPPLVAKMDTAEQKRQTITSRDEASDLPPVAPPIDHVKNALQQAIALYGQGRLNDAEVAFKRVLVLDPRNSDANYNLGAIAEGRGDWRAANNYYLAALSTNPGDEDARTALNSVKQKLAMMPNGLGNSNPSPFGTTSQSAGEPVQNNGEAKIPFTPPNNAAINSSQLRQSVDEASQAFKKGDFDRSISLLQGVATQVPNDPDVQYALAQSYRGKGQFMAARTALNQAITLAPQNQLYKDALRDLDRTIANGGVHGISDHSGYANQTAESQGANYGSASDYPVDATSGPVGQVTPFTGIAGASSGSSQGWQPMSPNTDTYSGGYGQYHPAYANRYANSSTTGRIERAAISGLAGAAVGALFGGAFSGYGNRGRGAMLGAGRGGMFGLILGGR
jgi:tetratricopeptide (TPR) repeat protein